jgi:hypothetical protein
MKKILIGAGQMSDQLFTTLLKIGDCGPAGVKPGDLRTASTLCDFIEAVNGGFAPDVLVFFRALERGACSSAPERSDPLEIAHVMFRQGYPGLVILYAEDPNSYKFWFAEGKTLPQFGKQLLVFQYFDSNNEVLRKIKGIAETLQVPFDLTHERQLRELAEVCLSGCPGRNLLEAESTASVAA